jgi:predicted secreted protein
MYKKMLSFVLAIGLLVSLGANGLALSTDSGGVAQISATVNLNGVQLDTEAMVIGGKVFIPVRSACEGLGYTVSWAGSNGRQTVTAASDKNTVVLDILSQTITVSGFSASMKDGETTQGCFIDDGHSYLSAELFSKAFFVSAQYDSGSGIVTITDSPKQIDTAATVGGTVAISLKGNPTTGYGWYYTIGDSAIIEKTDDSFTSDSSSAEIVGAGGTFTWNFKALKAGETTITFKYYRSWLGESSAAVGDTVIYKITVK